MSSDDVAADTDVDGNRHMEYVRQRGSYDDLPLDDMLRSFAEVYGDRFGTLAGAAAAGDAAFDD